MGFGKKVDYSDPRQPARVLNLDATYEAIIKPAVVANGMRCIRSDEVGHSGLIDTVMYEMLLRADLVVADISTANPNAIYELGVRHALRPKRTIIIKEVDGAYMFDLSHLATLQYKHLGEDIGHAEAIAKRTALTALIKQVLATNVDDSPVYAYLKNLRQPVLSEVDYATAVDVVVNSTSELSTALAKAREALKRLPTDHTAAREHFARALELQRSPQDGGGPMLDPDPYLVQQLALHTYKARQPNITKALRTAWTILGALHPMTSTDSETLGIGGAIMFRLWQQLAKPSYLDTAIVLYGRGYEVRLDYYTGENYAACLDERSMLDTRGAFDSRYDRHTARLVRARVYASLKTQIRERGAALRPDYHWMLATLANVGYALGESDAVTYEKRFRSCSLEPWMVETFNAGKARALQSKRGSRRTRV